MFDLPSGGALWIAIAQIVGIDIVLSGDNAVVIALAARGLPKDQQRRAVLWGTGAAIAMRVALTSLAAVLLHLPGLKLAGGLLLIWIGVNLLLPERDHAHAASEPVVRTLGGAIRTILLADAAMSLDNVVAVAAASHGNLLLLLFGLALSIPLMIGTSALLLRIMDRYPAIVTLGGALIGYVAGTMAVTDPLLERQLSALVPNAGFIGGVVGLLLVVVTGKWLAARRRAPAAPIDLVEAEPPP